MNMDQLKYYLAVVEQGSVNSVADRFFMTPQAINASLRKLETEFASPLLNRSKKGVVPTPQGLLFAEWAKNIVNQYEKMQLVLTAYNNESSAVSGTLSVFSASIFTDTFLPSMVRDFTQIFPNVNIKIITVRSSEVLPHFFGGYCNVAFLTASNSLLEMEFAAQKDTTVKLQLLTQDHVVLCAQPNHPLMKYSIISSELLSDYIKKTNSPISFFHILTANSAGILYPKAISDSNSVELHKKLMLENNAVTCMPKLAYRHSFQNDGFAAVPMTGDDSIVHAILYRDDDTLPENKLIAQFVRTLERQFSTRYGTL